MTNRVERMAAPDTAMLGSSAATARIGTATLLTVDASQPAQAPRSGTLRMGTDTNPDGGTIGINSRYLTRDGKPWLPVMGEFHYSRVPEAQWDDELAKVKSAGIEILATYIIWSHHEAQAGHFDWSGRRDLKRFVETCAQRGLLVFVRIGPWVHAEVRYGGIPEWIVNQMPTRSDDPMYLAHVERFYRQIAAQLEGNLWKDGGPVIGVQLENEYNLTGPNQGAAHIATLKHLAVDAGLDTPLYTVTGWDNAVFPHREVTPVFGGYPDLPWATTSIASPPNEVYAFRFTSRVGGDLGAQTKGGAAGDADAVALETPFLGAEYGGGVPTMYRRRPVIDPDDIGAMLPVQLGSGVNLYGYYMFHGGRNPPHPLHGQESTATGGWNDLPVINYDFQAPLGSNGEVHPVLGKIRPMHLFLHEWGTALATYAVCQPDLTPRSADDPDTPRFSVRANGERGFLFFNNHVRQHPLPVRHGVRFAVKLRDRTVTLPAEPVDIPSGAYFVWPVALPLHDAQLRYASAQPMTRLTTLEGDTWVFRAVDGITSEFAFETHSVRSITSDSCQNVPVRVVDDALLVNLSPGDAISVTTASGRRFMVALLSQRDAERATVVPIEGARRLVITDATVFESHGQLVLRSVGDSTFAFGVYPPLDAKPPSTLPLDAQPDAGIFQMYTAHANPHSGTVAVSQIRGAAEVPPIAHGGPANASVEPVPETYGKSAAWRITLPADATKGLSNAYLSIRYTGDVGRLFCGADLVDDDFYTGLSWNIGLRNVPIDPAVPLTLTVLPLRADAPVYLDERFDPRQKTKDQVATLDSVMLIPEYEMRIGRPG
ncbi:beta-galactosidase [Paraburkholderia sp. GAS448]|uniref:beta-galactosidase n=1 Tax=Paraburkholderia sp. GAS448 TaxID=3035136 RepID=UPI003D1B7F2C